MSVEFDNVSQWTKALENAVGRVRTNTRSALEEANTRVVLRSIEYTPTYTGALAASRAAYIQENPRWMIARVTYNENGSVPYAVDQHENPNYSHNHPWNPQNAQYKFLERAYKEEENNIKVLLKEGVSFK